jgi:hypothetical protein
VGFRGLGGAAAEAGKLIRDAFVAMPEIAGLVAVFASVGEAIKKVREVFEYGDQLNALGRQTGETANNIAVLRRTFEYFDVSADSVGTTLFMLQRSLGGVSEAGAPTGAAFARIGLSIAELRKMNAPDQFAAIQKGLARLPDQASRSATAMEIFGRSALEVQSILNADPGDFAQSMKDAQEYAQVMGQNADAFEEIERKFFIFREQIDTVFARIGAGLIPAVQGLLGLVNQIDFSKWGRGIGAAIGLITQAFSQGKVGELLELTLVLAFKQAINTMVGLIYGLAGAFQALFTHIPDLLSSAFKMLSDPAFWKGIGELLLGGLLSVQGRIAKIFLDAVNGLGNRLADILEQVPGFSGTVEALRDRLSRGSETVNQGLDQATKAGDSMTASGLADVKGAASPLAGDILKTLWEQLQTAMAAYTQHGNAIDTSTELKRIGDILGTLRKAIPAPGDPAAPRTGAAGLSGTSLPYKMPESDRLSRVGLFVGSSPATPGLTEARRTAQATEESRGILRQILVHFSNGSVQHDVAVYAE